MRPSIVCGIDASLTARRAGALAAALATRLGGRLIVVHVVPGSTAPLLPGLPPYPPTELMDRHRRLREAGERLITDVLRDTGGVDVRGRVEAGTPGERILAVAKEQAASFIVLGTRGDGAVSAALLGSTTEAVVARARCPVLVVPPGAAQSERQPLAGKCVVVGVKSDDDQAPLRVGDRLARALTLPMAAAHISPLSEARAAGAPVVPVAVRRTPAKGQFRVRSDKIADGSSHVVPVAILGGEPGPALAALAAQRDAALLVVGAHGHGRLRARLLGSMFRDLARSARVPVLICPRQREGGPRRSRQRDSSTAGPLISSRA